jgi:hypothetical protein
MDVDDDSNNVFSLESNIMSPINGRAVSILCLGSFIFSIGFSCCLNAEATDVPLANPAFTFSGKNSEPDQWQVYPPAKTELGKVEADPSGGVRMVDKDPNNGLGLGQWVPVIPGHKYVATTEAKGTGGLSLNLIFLEKKPNVAAELNKEKLADARQSLGDTPDFKQFQVEATAPAEAGVVFIWFYSAKITDKCDMVVKSVKLQDMGVTMGGTPSAAPTSAVTPAPPAIVPAPAQASGVADNIGAPKAPNPLIVPPGSLPKGIIQVVDFETGDVSQASWIEGGRKSMSTDLVRHGKYALKIELAKDKHRSEVDTARVEPYGEFKYGWSIYIPKDFDTTSWFSIVSQWHTYGSGKNYKPDGGPPTSISIGKDGKWSLKIQFQDKDTDNCASVHLPFGSIEEDRGRWTDFVMEANWQSPQTGGGYVRLYKDGKKVVDYVGPTWFEGKTAGPFFKVGIYRGSVDWKGDEAKSILYFDDLRVGGSQATIKDVDPAQQP